MRRYGFRRVGTIRSRRSTSVSSRTWIRSSRTRRSSTTSGSATTRWAIARSAAAPLPGVMVEADNRDACAGHCVAQALPMRAAADRIKMQQPPSDRLLRRGLRTLPVRANSGKKTLGLARGLLAAPETVQCGRLPGRHCLDDVHRVVGRLDGALIVAAEKPDADQIGPMRHAGREGHAARLRGQLLGAVELCAERVKQRA